MKLTIISDTHMRHQELGTLNGDVLIHCGDFLKSRETEDDLDDIDKWFGQQDFKIIICI
jgi:predicted phosphodiesterase